MQIPSFKCSGTMVIELCEFNDKKKKNKKNTMDKMQKLNCCYNLAKMWYFNEIFGTQIIFYMFCAVKSN